MRVRRALLFGLLLLAVGLLLARQRSTREGMNADCACNDPTYSYDSGKKKCIKKGEGGKDLEANPICCGLGQVWDTLQSKCATSAGKQGGVMEVP
jgi:hypothetical protein